MGKIQCAPTNLSFANPYGPARRWILHTFFEITQ
jgi:hypothetical protein